MSKLRPRKDGLGFSECSAPDELVGKGKCCHVIAEGQPDLELSKVQRGMYEVKIGDEGQSTIVTMHAQKRAIIQFFDQLGKLDEDKIQSIIAFLDQEG